LADPPQHRSEAPSRAAEPGVPGPNWAGLVAVLRELPPGAPRFIVVMSLIATLAAVAVLVCSSATSVGMTAGATLAYRYVRAVRGFLR
jgi:hypothetical protein